MIGFNGGLIGKDRTTTAAAASGVWTLNEQIKAKRNNIWPGALWDPTVITTALWLDAADSSTITLNGSTVSQWNDKSSNARNASQATAANQPTYSATGFNSKPTVQFDGSNDQLDLIQFAQVSDQNIFAVADTTNLGSSYRIFMNRSDGGAPATYFGGDGGSGQSYRPLVYWNSAERANFGSSVQRKAIFRWSFATGATALTQIDGGTPVTASFTATTLANWSAICFSSVHQPDVDISEIIITPATLSTSDRQKLEGYLAHKWGLTSNLTGDHPYKTNLPTV